MDLKEILEGLTPEEKRISSLIQEEIILSHKLSGMQHESEEYAKLSILAAKITGDININNASERMLATMAVNSSHLLRILTDLRIDIGLCRLRAIHAELDKCPEETERLTRLIAEKFADKFKDVIEKAQNEEEEKEEEDASFVIPIGGIA